MQRIWQSRLMQRLWTVAGAVSIRVKVLGIVVGVVALLGAFVILQMRQVLADTLRQSLEEQGVALVGHLAEDAADVMRLGDTAALQELLAEQKLHYSTNSHNTAVDYITVEDASGQIIAAEGRSDEIAGQAAGSPVGDHSSVTVATASETLEIRRAIPGTNSLLRLGLSQSSIAQTVSAVTLQLFAITLVMVAIGFAAAFFLTWFLTRPILDLVAATHRVAGGDFNHRAPHWADDEIGELALAFNQMTHSLAGAERERIDRESLRQEYVHGVILAQENERQRIARELHDSTSQSLTSLLVGLQNLKQTQKAAEMSCRVDELRGVIAATLDEIRDIAWRLRPSALDDLGLISALENTLRSFQSRYGIPVEVVISGLDGRLAPEIETTVYRIIQEGLTNIARYAQATQASLVITHKHGRLKIIIEDNGIGFDPAAVQKQKTSLGLYGMGERARLFGGSLIIESQPGQGTHLFIELPYGLAQKGPEHD